MWSTVERGLARADQRGGREKQMERDGDREWGERHREKNSKIIKSSVNVQIKKKILITFQLYYTAKNSCACSCGAKKYRFDSTIVRHILVFNGAKNSNIAI